jgi:hypothetical protein
MQNQNSISDVSLQGKLLVGFAGTAGIGKSTLATLVSGWCNGIIIPYSKPLKESLVKLTGLSMDYFTDIELKEKIMPGLGKTPRQIMQLFGTEFVRNMIASDFWIWRMKQEFEKHQDKNIFIDDIRFNNEAQLIRDNGGIIIHLIRKYEKVTKESDHISELPITKHKWDMVFDISNQLPTISAMHIIDMLSEFNNEIN